MKQTVSKLKKYIFNMLVNDDADLKAYEQYKIDNREASSLQVLFYLIKKKLKSTNATNAGKPTVNSSIREPYIGIESTIANRHIPTLAALLLNRKDIILFSIFDTLIFIPFYNKNDIYLLLESKLNIIGFKNLRVQIEKNLTDSSYNYSIEDIYKEINKITGLDIEYGINTEIELWKQLIHPNKYMNIIFHILKEQGKKIIIIEDTFFSNDDISDMLKKCGYYDYTELIISSQNKYSKMQGSVYDYIKEKFNNLSLIHIGSDFIKDSKIPREHGIETKFYNSCHAYGMKQRATGISPLFSSAYFALVNQYLHKDDKMYTQFYELGYIYGGFCLLGYINYIIKYCSINYIEKVIFTSSTGSFIKTIFDNLPDNSIENVEILWSEYLHKYFHNGNTTDLNMKYIIHEYVIPLVGDNKKILIIDNDLTGTFSLDLKIIFSQILPEIECHSILLANPSHVSPYVLNENTNAYLFDNHHNLDLYGFHNKKDYTLILNLFIQNNQPELITIKDISQKLCFEFDEPNIEYFHILEETHRGIMDFILQYTNIFKQNKVMFNINGHDAYMPLKFLFSNKKTLNYFTNNIKKIKTW